MRSQIKNILVLPVAMAAAATFLLVMIPPSWAGLWPHDHVHIVNELAGGKVLLVHCHSKDHDRGVQYVNVGNEYVWRFKPRVFFQTLWRCYLAPDDHRHVVFDAYNESHHIIRIDYNVYWIAKEDGIYNRDQKYNMDYFSQPWQPGRMPLPADDDDDVSD